MARLVVFAAMLASICSYVPAADAVFELPAAAQVRSGVVVSLGVPAELQGKRLVLQTVGGDASFVVQRDTVGGRGIALLPGPIPAGLAMRFRLQEGPASPSVVVAEDDGQRVVLKVRGKQVLAYNQAVVPSPDPKEPCYARSGYLHPVLAPSGQQVTDDFNPNHAHQHGIMFAWRKITFEGRESNGWDQKLGSGRVEHVKLETTVSGPVFGGFTARLRQLDLTAPGGSKPVLDETWTVRVYDLPDPFLFDLEAVQTCASASPVNIDKIHYGGLMIRGRADWSKGQKYDYLTSEGKSKADGDQPQARWCDIFGPADAGTLGAAILGHPENFHAPQPVRLHPKMPYFCFTPATAGEFTIAPGEKYVSRFRFVIHDGPADASRLEAFWQALARPAELRRVSGGE